MAKVTRKTVAISALISDDSVNVRLSDNYDLESIIPQLLAKGKIINPLIVEPAEEDGKFLILQGNRRFRGAKALLADPNLPDEIKKHFEKVDVIIYDGLDDKERTALVIDHGEWRTLNREETVLAVWRLDKQFFSEKSIGEALYSLLARYTGNEKKLNAIPKDAEARAKYLRDWFRGTLGSYILAAARMGEYVRQQFVLTARAEDGRLKEGEKVEMRCDRTRVVELSKAKNADADPAMGGKGWTAEAGGEKFNALIEKFKAEDAGTADKDKSSRPSAKEIKERMDVYRSPAIKNALACSLGDTKAGAALVELDDKLTRRDAVDAIIHKRLGEIKDEKLRALLVAMLSDRLPVGEVEVCLNAIVS